MKSAIAYLLTALTLLAPGILPPEDATVTVGELPRETADAHLDDEEKTNPGPLKPVIVEESMAPEPTYDPNTMPEYRLFYHLTEVLSGDDYLSVGYYETDAGNYFDILYLDEAAVRAEVENFEPLNCPIRYAPATYSYNEFLRHSRALYEAFPDYFTHCERRADYIALTLDDRFENRIQAWIDSYERGDLFRVVDRVRQDVYRP